MGIVRFYSLTPKQYSSIANKDNDALYFLTNGEIYKGDTLLSNNVEIIPNDEDYPETGENNKLYAKLNGESAFWNGSSYTLISHSIIAELQLLENRIDASINSIFNVNKLIDRTITEINSEDIVGVGSYAFQDCTGLTSINLPNVTTLSSNSFKNCTSLTSISSTNLPNVTNIGAYGFNGCTSLTSVDFPNATTIGGSAFYGCKNLTSVDFPNVTNIGAYGFNGCTSLTTIVLSKNQVATLSNASAFNSTPIKTGTGYIYVPDDLVDSYKAATNWKTYKNQIKGISELPSNNGGE